MSSKILLRRGTAAEWSSANPILGTGELGIETDTLKIKIGNGSSTWSQLSSYANVTPAQLTSQINSLISAAPSTLDTLNELAAAINNDASFSTTVNNLLTGKVSKSGGDTITSSTASTVGLVIQGAAFQTANLQQWKNSAGTTLGTFDKNGILTVIDFSAGAVNATWRVYATAGNSTITPMVAIGAASQTANLQEWQNSAGTVLARVASNGDFTNNGIFTVYGRFGGASFTDAAALRVNGYSTDVPTAVIKGIASQTGNLQEWQDSSGTVLSKIDAYGNTSTLNLYAGGFVGLGAAPSGTTRVIISPTTSSLIGLVVKGAASQSVNLTEWQGSGGNSTTVIDPYGAVYVSDTVMVGPKTSWSGDRFAAGGLTIVNRGGASAIPFGVRGAASQTADLTQWQDSTNNILSKIDYRGILSSKVAFGDFWGPIWETVTAGSNDQSWKKLVVISLPDNYYSGIQFKIDINNAVTNFGSSAYPEKSTYTVAATRAGGALNDSLIMTLTGPEGDKYIRGMKLSNGTYEIQFRQPSDWTDVVVRVQPISAQPFLRGLSDLYTFYPLSSGGTAASTGGTIYTPVVGGTDRFSFISAQSFVKIGGTSSQFLKADGSVDSSTYITTAIPYVAGHHAEGRYLASAALMNDLGNARLRGSTFTFTNISPTNSQIDTMFDGTAGVVVWTTSGITFPVVIEFTLPRTLQYGATVGVGFGNATWRANSVKIEAFSNNAWVTCIDTTTNTSEDVLANIPGGNATPGTTKLRYTFANPNSVQFRICHLWAFNYNSDMWTQLQMPRAGGTMYGSLAVQGSTQTLGTTNVVQNVVRGVSGQTSNLAEWQNSANSVVASIAPDGTSTLGSMSITAGTHKAYGPFEILNNAGGNSVFSVIGFGGTSSASLTIGIKNTDNANNRNWQLLVGGGGFAGQSGNYIGEGGLVFTEKNPNDSSSADRAGFRRGGQFALGGLNTYSASLSVTPLSTSTIGQVIRANASQTANLQEWQQSDGSATYIIDANGHMYASSSRGLFLNTGYIGGTRFAVASVSASQIGMIIRGNTSQTGNLTEWRNVGDTVLASIDANGQGAFKSTTLTASSSGESALTLVAASGQTAPLLSTAGGAKITAGGNYFEAPGIQSNYIMSASAGNSTIVPLTVKGASSQTANLQEWQNSAGDVLASISPSLSSVVTLKFTEAHSFKINWGSRDIFSTASGHLTVTPYDDSRKVLVVKGYGVQTANLTEWQNSSGGILARIAANGVFYTGNGGTYISSNGDTFIQGSSATAPYVQLVVKGAASQTGNLQQWQNSAGTALSSISSSGRLAINTSSDAGGRALYVVQPNGGYGSVFEGVGIIPNVTIYAAAGGVGLVVASAASQTANLTEWQNSAGTVVAKVDSSGSAQFSGFNVQNSITANGTIYTQAIGSTSDYAGNAISINSGKAVVMTPAAASIGLVVKGAASQTANLQEWQNSAGTVLAKVDSNGDITLSNASIAATGGNITTTYGLYSNLPATTNAGLAVKPWATNIPGAIIRGAASQTADLQQWQNSSGTVLTSVRPDGSLLITKNGDLATGQAAAFISSPVNTGHSTSSVYSFWYQSGTGISNPAAQTLGINSNNVERMRFTTAGLILINSSSSTLGGGSVASQLGVVVAEATTVGTVIRGAASQTANLQEWQTSAGTVVSSINADGNTFATSAVVANYITSSGANSPYFDMSAATSNTITLVQRTAAAIGLIVKGAASQTADLQQWTNVGGTVLAKITASGALDVTAITVNGAAITSTPTTSDVELMNIMGAY